MTPTRRSRCWRRRSSRAIINDETSRRLATIPGIGPIIASAIVASAPDAAVCESGRQFAAWLRLVPKQNSTGGKERLGRITKTGNRYIRRLLVIGATGLIRYKRRTVPGGLTWLSGLLAKKPVVRLVTVALANKMARIASAIVTDANSRATAIVYNSCGRAIALQGAKEGHDRHTAPPSR